MPARIPCGKQVPTQEVAIMASIITKRAFFAPLVLAMAACLLSFAPSAHAVYRTINCGEVVAVGHRGTGANSDENTIPAFIAATQPEYGVEAVEFDVRLTSDNRFVILHDRSVDRMTNGTGLVRQKTLRQIRRLRTVNGSVIPTFGETIRTIAPSGDGVQVHVKVSMTASQIQSMWNALQANGFSTSNVQFNSDNVNMLNKLYAVTGAPTGFTYIGPPTTESIDQLAADHVTTVMIHEQYLTQEWVSYIMDRGMFAGTRGAITREQAASLGAIRVVVDAPQQPCQVAPAA